MIFLGGVYVDLLDNEERYTGYAGHTARKIWAAIYSENCFKSEIGSNPPTGSLTIHPKNDLTNVDISDTVFENPENLCPEGSLFYRLLSGNEVYFIH